MGGNSDADDVLRTAIERRPLFRVLQGDGGATRNDVQEALDVSRSTAHRIVKRFERMELIAQENGQYTLTPLGEVVAEETRRATDTVAVARRLSPLLETLQETRERVDLSAFDEATVTVPEPGDPYRPMRRLVSLVDDASRIREFAPTAPEPAYQSRLLERTRNGLRAAVIYPASVVERVRTEMNTDLEHTLTGGDRFALRVGYLPGFRLVIADEHVYLGGYNDNSSQLRLVADTDKRDAVEWARRVFRNHWRAATPYADYESGSDD